MAARCEVETRCAPSRSAWRRGSPVRAVSRLSPEWVCLRPDQYAADNADWHRCDQNRAAKGAAQPHGRRCDGRPEPSSWNEPQRRPPAASPDDDQVCQPSVDRRAQSAVHRARIRAGSVRGECCRPSPTPVLPAGRVLLLRSLGMETSGRGRRRFVAADRAGRRGARAVLFHTFVDLATSRYRGASVDSEPTIGGC